MTKKYIFFIVTFLFCIACNKKNRYVTDEITFPVEAVYAEEVSFDATPINIMDSLHYEDTLGEVIEYEYEGLLPAADGPGIEYDLTIWAQERSKEGVFSLSTTYLEDSYGESHTYTIVGKKRMLHRKHEDKEEVIYELIPQDGTSSLFLCVDGEDLIVLNQAMEHMSSQSNHNYTLKRKK